MIRPEYLDITRIIKDPKIFDLFSAVQQYGGALRFVGGAVRDTLAGLEGFELDLATDLSPDELSEACSAAGIKTIPIGLKFSKTGVIINNHVLEVSSLYKPSSSVSDLFFTDDWNADASTRDLTINAVYADEHGNVFDYYNGISDLENGIVRFIGSASEKIKEQPIRIMRFFRFFSIFSKSSEPELKSFKACIEHKGLLKNLAVEQIRNEFFKILCTQNAPQTLQMMFENDVLDFLLPAEPNISALKTLETLVCHNNLCADIIRRLYVLYEPDTLLAENLATRLHLTKEQKARLLNFSKYAFNSTKAEDETYLKKVAFLHGKDFVKDKLLLSLAACGEAEYNLQSVFCKIDALDIPTFPINGKDLIELGMTDCSPIKEIIAQLKNLWIESGFTMSESTLKEHAKKMIK